MARSASPKDPVWDAAAARALVQTATAHGAIVHGDNLTVTATLPDESARLIYLDPPFNTGRTRRLQSITTTRRQPTPPATAADSRVATTTPSRARSRGMTTRSPTTGRSSSRGSPRPGACSTTAAPSTCTSTTGRRTTPRSPSTRSSAATTSSTSSSGRTTTAPKRPALAGQARHDPRLREAPRPLPLRQLGRRPRAYMAPGLVTPEKAARGKLPTDVWWHTIVSTNGAERTGYPTQKPEGILRRIVQASTEPGDLVSTSSPALARRAPPPRRSGAASCWWTRARMPWPSCESASRRRRSTASKLAEARYRAPRSRGVVPDVNRLCRAFCRPHPLRGLRPLATRIRWPRLLESHRID